MSAPPSLSNVFSDVYITGNCVIGGTVTSLANPVNSLMTILQDQKASGTNGGGSSVGWQTRTLNTSVLDQIGVSLGSNQFTLPAGTYYVQISTPATQVNNHRCRLYNVTTSSTVLLGTSEIAQNATPGNMTNRSFIDAYFTNASSGTYRVDHYCATAFANNSLGSNASSGDVEIFTTVKIIKINSGAALSQWTTSGTALTYGSGNVGIGTTNPSGSGTPGSLLHVYDTTSANPTIHVDSSGGTGQARLHLRAGAGATNRASRIDFFNNVTSSTVPQWTIISGYDQNGTNDLRFVNYTGTITSTWAQTGYVGIGTTNPGSLLTVAGGVAVGSGYQTFTAPTGGLIVQGNVGIGTSNPGVNALQVSGNVVTSGFTSNATNTVFNFDTLTVPFVNATQVGIGTTTPSCNLDIRGVVGITNTVPYAVPNRFMQNGTLTIGDGSLNYGGGSGWNSNTAGFMMECLNTTECAIHDSGDRIASFMYYSGNKIGIGRDMGWGVISGVGIGTTNPAVKFHVEQGQMFIGNSAYLWGTASEINSASGYNIRFDNTYNPVGSGTICNKISLFNNGSTWQGGFSIESSAVVYHSGTNHTFYTGTSNSAYGTERMKIVGSTGTTAGGTTGYGVLFGHAGIAIDRGWSDNPSITVCNTNQAGTTTQGTFRVHGTNCSYSSYPAAGGADFSVNMQIDGTSYLTSDRRAKTNVTSITDALDLVMKLDGKRYQRVNRLGDVQHHISENGYKFGFIAQDLQVAQVEEMYIHNKDDDDGTDNFNNAYCVDYASLVAVLVNAMKEQQSQINSLEARIAALEAK